MLATKSTAVLLNDGSVRSVGRNRLRQSLIRLSTRRVTDPDNAKTPTNARLSARLNRVAEEQWRYVTEPTAAMLESLNELMRG